MRRRENTQWALVALAVACWALAFASGCDRAAQPAAPTQAASPDASAPPSAAPTAPASRLADPVAACAGCHPEQADHFAETGMGRAFYRPEKAERIEDFDPKKATVTHPKTGAIYQAYIDPQGRWWQSESFPGRPGKREVQVDYVVGSGNHTRTYLGVVEGELIELPLTWYSRRRIWDMSPGYETKNHFRFTRAVKPECMFCHNDLTPVVPGTMANYQAPIALGISCARCHGDGTAHVAQREAGKGPPTGQADPSILNPARLPPAEQLGVCEQCHLAGEARVLLDGHTWDAYDPRTPLAEYMSIFVNRGPRGADFSIASHGDRLAQSACAQRSDGKLTCTTCHNPHKPSTPESHRAACLSCHQVSECGEEHAAAKPNAECWTCHMRKGDTSDIPHVTFTDHWIRQRPGAKEDAAAAAPKSAGPPALVDALASRRKGPDPHAVAREAVAHADIWRYQKVQAHLPVAAPLLEGAAQTSPHRLDVWISLARVREAKGDRVGAAKAYEAAVKLAPTHAPLLVDQAQNLEDMGDLAGAERALRRALEARPDYRAAWGNLGNVLARQGRMPDADAAYERADALAPHEALTPQNRGFLSIGRREYDRAIAFFEETQRRDPVTAVAPFGLANALLAQGKLNEALPHLNEALRIDPSYTMALWYRGRVFADLSQWTAARRDLERWRTLEPHNPNAHVELAQILLGAGDKAAARRTLSEAALKFPGHPQIGALLNVATQP